MDQLDDLDITKWCEDRDGYMRLGMAFKHQTDGTDDEEPAYGAWCNYSKQSKKFDEKTQRADWLSFKGKTSNPVTMRSILKAAKEGRIINTFDEADDDEDEVVDNAPASFDAIPRHLLSIPGDLQHVVDYYNDTAHQASAAVCRANRAGAWLGRRGA